MNDQPNHMVCYVQRKRITDWKRLVLTHDEPTFIYGSNDSRVFASKLGSGSTLWVVSSLPARPPELVARLRVTIVAELEDHRLKIDEALLRHFREFKWIAKAGPRSEFFGHNNAGSALLRTVFCSPSGDPRMLSEGAKRWRGKYGMKLQRPSLVATEGMAYGSLVSPGSAPLEELAKSQARSVFISWKWRDNSRNLIRSLAYALAEQGFMPWLDLLALPAGRALKKVQHDAKKLERLLKYGYRRCAGVIAIDSAHYGEQTIGSEQNWTLREWAGELAPERQMVRISYRPTGNAHSEVVASADVQLRGRSPDQAACELKDWFDSTRQS
ncbi:MAG: hypothetical protein JXA14_05365 [Anaerolineae bacterium]|nr:hypothetical protein [Anaerolineae bacterium]